MMDFEIKKYPRTPHIEGSRLQPGDEDLSQIPFEAIKGKYIVIEEKVDGANTAISFRDDGEMLLQSRGHYLTGGYRERHYEFMKKWAAVHRGLFREVLGCRYIMYGEWLYAKHTIYYNRLPHYFMEFDIFDREKGVFLDTPSRRKITGGLPICSVPVLTTGAFDSKDEVLKYLGQSLYISGDHMTELREKSLAQGLDADRVIAETDPESLMEGFYFKVEENGTVVDRMKFVRRSFLQAVDQSGSHWLDRPIVLNGLRVPIEELYNPNYHG